MGICILALWQNIQIQDIALCRLLGSLGLRTSHMLTNLPEVKYKMYPIHKLDYHCHGSEIRVARLKCKERRCTPHEPNHHTRSQSLPYVFIELLDIHNTLWLPTIKVFRFIVLHESLTCVRTNMYGKPMYNCQCYFYLSILSI